MSGSADNIKQWKCPNVAFLFEEESLTILSQGEFIRNFSGHKAIINTMAINQDGVVVSGADNGSIQFWDW